MKYIFMRYPQGKTKAVTVSYDDGIPADLKLAAILDKYNMKGTFNICSSLLGKERYLSADEVQKFLIDKGHEIAVHGANHRAPGSQRPFAAMQDILNCRISLEQTFRRIIRGMAYPDSGIKRIESVTSYEKICSCLETAGIVYARTLGGDNNTFALPGDWYAWMPTAHHNNSKLFQYVDEFVNLDIEKLYTSSRYPRLFYLWGHSSEFDRDDNWDLMERFCSEIGNKADTWYATNMEIYDYVMAYNQLIFSADETIVYNPTLVTVWFDVDKRLYSIKPGETLVIG